MSENFAHPPYPVPNPSRFFATGYSVLAGLLVILIISILVSHDKVRIILSTAIPALTFIGMVIPAVIHVQRVKADKILTGHDHVFAWVRLGIFTGVVLLQLALL